jgi:FKBP-type peptidyl-prolyl cis-trans isomerase
MNMVAAINASAASVLDAQALELEQTLIALARGLGPALRARAAQTESLRRIPDETEADFRAAGFYKAKIKDLMVEDLVVGAGRQAMAGDYVCIDYTGSYFAGTGAQEVTFGEACNFDIELQLGEVIRGLEDGIVGMKVGGQRRISIPARLAYGAKGCYPNIPPQMPLFIVVTLHKVYTRVLED